MNLTEEQALAVNKEGTNIIVSAGAGSGKTAVLTQRVIRKLLSGVNVNELLILTFTNEAANEMKNRIRDKIIANHLDKQLVLLDEAYITTFDSYALSLVKKYNYLLNVSDNLKIIDSSIITIYKYHVLEDIFDSLYDDTLFTKLINDICLKDDKVIKDYIINVSNKIDLEVDPDNYLNNYLDNHFNETYLNDLFQKYLSTIKNKIAELSIIYDRLTSYLDDKLITKLDSYLRPLFDGNTYEDYLLFKTMPSVRFTKLSEEGIKYKEEFKDKISEILSLLKYDNKEDILNSITDTYDYISVIIDIIKELNKKVKAYKESLNVYEFNDISHMAIDIVKNNPEAREEIKTSFNEIMIDEYQDTSDLQETFISYIANHNVYMVGDIKQSIYRFRNANPYIFQEKYNQYRDGIDGFKIDLIKNFRSRKETLQNINEIFNLIMDEDIGNAKYLEEHNMIYGNTAYDEEDTGSDNNLEIYHYEYSKEEEFTKEEKELFIISEDINNKIKNHYQVFDKKTGKLRNLEYHDICIITDRNKYLADYRKILEYHEIPSTIYMDETLTGDINFLVFKNLIDFVWHVKNKLYDQKFKYLYTSIARSFLFNYNDDDIYQTHKNNTFYESDIYKIALNISFDKPIIDTINDIINAYHIYERLLILPNIEKNIIVLDNLIDLCQNISTLGYSLDEIINYLDEVNQMELPIKYSLNNSVNNAVKIMNIHKSKGLEFSLCYFTGMHNKFTIKEITSKLLYSNKYGLIMPYLKEDSLESNIINELYKNEYYQAEISEKIRLFYVALTRCREKMIIVTSLDEERVGYNHLVPSIERMKYRSFLDILNSLSILDKYTKTVSAHYTHEYNEIKLKEIINKEDNQVITKKALSIDYQEINNKHFSKETNKLLTIETLKAMEYGTKVHTEMEYTLNDNLFKQIANNYLNIYHEYEFSYLLNDNKYYGIIDLMVEYDNEIYIIDYKLKDIEDTAYIDQLAGYKNYISSITNKNIKTFLYSIKDNILKEVKCE